MVFNGRVINELILKDLEGSGHGQVGYYTVFSLGRVG
jgi:hypothetical protein